MTEIPDAIGGADIARRRSFLLGDCAQLEWQREALILPILLYSGGAAMAKIESARPLLVRLDGLASLIVALLLWLLPLNPYSYAGGAIVLAALVCAFIWLLPLPIVKRKLGCCVLSCALLSAVLIPSGIERFAAAGSSQMRSAKSSNLGNEMINAPNNNGIIAPNNSGTITQGLPIPPPPSLKQISETETDNPDGTYTFSRTVEMNAPYAGSLIFTIKAGGLIKATVSSITPVLRNLPNGNTLIISGGGMQQNVMQGDGFFSTTIPTPSGQYAITVITRSKVAVTIETNFQ